MSKTLKALYDSFYTPLPMPDLEAEAKSAHRKLIERLDKQDRRLVLQIIDAQDAIAHHIFCGQAVVRRQRYKAQVHMWIALVHVDDGGENVFCANFLL